MDKPLTCPDGFETRSACPSCRWEDGLPVGPSKVVNRNVVAIRHNAPDTSRQAAEAVLPRSGTKRVSIYEAIEKAGSQGLCDHEIEYLLNMRIPSVTSIRNSLMRDGLIEDSGNRRKTPSGNSAIVWRITARELTLDV
jgi:hypothetical protein